MNTSIMFLGSSFFLQPGATFELNVELLEVVSSAAK